MKGLWLGVVIVLLAGCASKPPREISRIPPAAPTIPEVQSQPQRLVGSEVRWGGEISAVENRATHTWVEVVGRPLHKDGMPDSDGHSDGRFIASLPGFADPAVYKQGYLLTVVGTVEQVRTRLIGEYQYAFPVVAVSGSYLWAVEADSEAPRYPPWWYYDPWPYYYRPFPFYPYYPRYH